MPIYIVLAIGSHWDSGSSVSLQFKSLADELVKRGYQVIILIPGQKKDKVIETGNPLVYTWPSKRPTKLQDALFLRQIIKKYRPVSMVANFAAVNWMMLVGWLMQVRIRIAWYHTVGEAIELDVRENRFTKIYHHIRKSLVYKLTTHIVSVSSYAVQKDLILIYRVPDSKIMVFHNLLKDPLGDRQISFFTQENKPVLTCVARMDYSKGHDILINAMSIIAARFPDVKLRLIGSGTKMKELQKSVKNLGLEHNVVFLGNLTPFDVISELAQSYVNIHPARIDNCSLALIESISVGTPVIASNAGGIPEIIVDNVNGILVAPGDSNALSCAVCRVLESPALRKTYSDNARKYFLSNFELVQGCQKIAAWLERQIWVSGVK